MCILVSVLDDYVHSYVGFRCLCAYLRRFCMKMCIDCARKCLNQRRSANTGPENDSFRRRATTDSRVNISIGATAVQIGVCPRLYCPPSVRATGVA